MKYAMLLCASLALVFVGADKATEVQKVRFRLSGAVCGGCASALAETLATSGVEHASKIAPNKGKGAVTVSGDIAEDADLSAIADAILQTETPHKNQAPPALALELFAKLDKESAAKALEALGEVNGVDKEKSTTDVRKGTIDVQLAGGEKLTVANLIDALNEAGIKASIKK